MSQEARRAWARAVALPGVARPHGGLQPNANLSSIGAWLSRQAVIEVEQRTPFLWLPVAFGVGAGLYFLADGRPNLVYAGLLAGSAALLAALLRRSLAWRIALIGLAMVGAGFLAAGLRTERVTHPVLQQLLIAPVTGFVETVERRAEGSRLVVRVHALGDLPVDARPRLVRVTTRVVANVKPGDFISATMRLLPPPEPARPGGYDFARDAFFKEVGAVGSVTGKIELKPPPHPPDIRLRWHAAIDEARNNLTDRVAAAFGGQAGAVAAALVTGKRGLIDEESNDALRAAGIYHVVSISGLHMVLVAGAIFWSLRALLALSTSLALLVPVKKIAAAAAMIGATCYCIFSGGEVATERSLIMTLTMMGAILFDRPALSLRNLAIAALIVLVLEPETLLGPSFQMSFAAVSGLVAFGALYFQRKRDAETAPPGFGWAGRAARTLLAAGAALVVTTVIATVATAPFGIYHFQTVNPYGLIGNALALPFVSLVVMPSAVLGAFLWPLGLDGPVWWLMGQGVAIVLAIAGRIEAADGARMLVPAFAPAALMALALALMMATLLASGLRWLALAPLVLGAWAAATPDRADIFIDREAQGAAIRGPEGRLVLVGRPSDFVTEQWLAADGDERRANDDTLRQGARCDRSGCVVLLPDGRPVSFLFDRSALAEDCARAALVILRGTASGPCAPAMLVDRSMLRARGAIAVTAEPRSHDRPARFSIAGARDRDRDKPWARVTTSNRDSDQPAVTGPRATRPRSSDPDAAQEEQQVGEVDQ